ncbi:MAG: protein phosphatase 2C domain-containing protein [Acidobacteriota bacterium]
MSRGTVICNLAARTDAGVVRSNNEDNLIMADLMTGQSLSEHCQLSYPLHHNSILMVVSDGVGGGNSGEVASELTVFAIKDALMRLPKHISAHDRLEAAVEEANNIVWNESRSNPNVKGMAATVTAILIDEDLAYIAEVGDSRAYLVRGGNIKQVTMDQSFVAHLVAKGVVKPENINQHARKNVILQAIGANEAVKVAVTMLQLQQGDALLMCTDGLSNMITIDEICHLVENLSPWAACKQMVELAKQRGGTDNITLIIAKFDGDGLAGNNSPGSGKLEMLSSFDPEQEIRKSHKRTNLLGNFSISNMYYGSPEPLPDHQKVNSLAFFPNSAVLRQECQALIEYLDYCYHLMLIKSEQVKQATEWLAGQGVQYAYLPELLAEIQTGLEQIQQAKQTAVSLMSAFDSNTNKEK